MTTMADAPRGASQQTPTKTLIVVSHTHWDREWYLPFQNFRFKLVKLIDNLLNLLDSTPDFAYFTLDGQTIVLDDYLEIRPEREADLKRHIASGRLLVGPWYILPDQFLISGEAHIQNMLRGLEHVRKFGEPMKIGYIPDAFGQMGQMPQILRGFGLDNAVIWRGVGAHLKQNEFIWQAPDGTAVDGLHLPGSKNIGGYSTGLAFNAGVDATMTQLEGIKNFLIEHSASGYVMIMNGNDHAEPTANLPQTLREAAARLQAKGRDWQFVHGTMPMFFEKARASGVWQNPETPRHVGEFRDSELAHLLPGVLSARMWIKQTNAKLENALERETGPLLAWTETLPQLPADYNRATLHSFYKTAWKYLLQNDPHDSICGCSVDAVHEDMKTRYSWVEQINGDLRQQTLQALAANLDTAATVKAAGIAEGQPAMPLVVFNPMPFKRSETTVISVAPGAGLEDFVITDSDGTVLPHKVLKAERENLFSMDIPAYSLEGMTAQIDGDGRVMGYSMTGIEFVSTESMKEQRVEITVVYNAATGTDPDLMRYATDEVQKLAKAGVENFKMTVFRQTDLKVAFLAKDVPAHGYKTFVLRARQPEEVATLEEVVEKEEPIENEFYLIEVDPKTGWLTVHDKETGAVYSGLNQFRDGADAGDEYNYSSCEQDKVIDKFFDAPQITVRRSALEQSIEIATALDLPYSLDVDRKTRSKDTALCSLTTVVSLVPGQRRIDFETNFLNRVEDHRLQVLFPAPFVAENSEAEGAFDVVVRPVSLPKFGKHWREDPVAQAPQKTFAYIGDAERKLGLTLINKGLPEFEVVPPAALSGDFAPDAPPNGSALALTLLRAVGWLSRDDFATRRDHAGPALPTPGAQMQGHHYYQYAIMPHKGDWLTSGSQQQAHAFNQPMFGIAGGVQSGSLPAQQSFMEIMPRAVVLSTVKRSEDGQATIVRVWNPATRDIPAVKIRFYRQPTAIALVNLGENEQVGEAQRGEDGWYSFPLAAKRIATLRLEF